MNKRQKLLDSLQSKCPADSSTSGTATSAALLHSQSSGPAVPPQEWQRCSEGFQLMGMGQDSKLHTELPSKRGQRHRKRCALLSVESVEQKATETVAKSERNFGKKWIQPEELFHVSGSQKSGSRIFASDLKLEVHATSTCQTTQDTDDESICWNNSDSDKEDVGEQPDSHSSKPVKKNWLKNPTCKPQRRRKTAKEHTAKPKNWDHKLHKNSDNDIDSDSDVIISAQESDEETSALALEGVVESPLALPSSSSKSESPVLQIECVGSPKPQSSPSPDEAEGKHLVLLEGSVTHPSLGSPRKSIVNETEGVTPSISSCASSQTGPDSQVSPSRGGLRASEWARQVKWETTPNKQKAPSPSDQGDSAKKKRKFAKGGLAEQMSRIILREKSANRMWQHQHSPLDIVQGSRSMTVRVRQLETAYSLPLADCSVVHTSSPHPHSANAQCCVLFSPHSLPHRAALRPGASVHIYPPWQQLDTSGGRKILLCTRFVIEKPASTVPMEASTEVSGAGTTTTTTTTTSSSSCPSSSPTVTGHGRWLCPCSTDGGLAATRCPAHLFPFLPASLMQHTSAHQHSPTTCESKTLHTVTSNEGLFKRTVAFNTLLESIEKARAGDRLLPSFQATVLRVFREQLEAGCDRLLLLVEDSQGTVAIISGADHVSDVEGCVCCFSSLHVQGRTNADRDPALFSTIAGAWSDKVKAWTTSQDSGKATPSDSSNVTSEHLMQPPGFCYLLDVDRSACDMLQGDDWLSVDTTPTMDPTAPLACCTLAQALQGQQGSSRVCVLVKVIYCSVRSSAPCPSQGGRDGNAKSSTSELFICDHSLQKTHQRGGCSPSAHQDEGELAKCDKSSPGDCGLPGYVKLQVRPDCALRGVGSDAGGSSSCTPFLLLLRDIWIVSGVWIADKYSTLVVLEGDSKEATAGRSRVDPDLQNLVRGCEPSLPAASSSSSPNSLVCVAGEIQSVDEKSAFSWEECDGCGSDQLAMKSSTGTLVCMRCRKEVSSPLQKMKMEVAVCCHGDPSLTIHINLLQSTIAKLLPNEENDEGYDVDCVLHKPLGPVNCIITSANRGATGVQMNAVELPL